MGHRRALEIIGAALALDLLGGVMFSTAEHLPVWHGLYWAIATATTVGDVAPQTALGHVIAVLVMFTVIPLFAAAFSLVTTGLTAERVRKHTEEGHRMLRHIVDHHPSIPPLPLEANGEG